MRIFRNLEQLPAFHKSVLTAGTFDGVHLGHQQILHRLVQSAKEYHSESIVLTFHPHPRLILQPDNPNLKLITTLEEKAALLEKYGVDNLVVIPFSRDFSQMEPEAYVKKFLVANFHPVKIIIGYNHRFGKDRKGDIHLLRKMAAESGFTVEEIPKQVIDHIQISSTRIRQALLSGDITTATMLLGHPFTLKGIVTRGQHLGRMLGFPTANIEVTDPYKLIPGNGVYAVKIEVNNSVKGGMLNIGNRPTFNGQQRTIEVHIFDFRENIYGETITVEFVKEVRGEMKFDSPEALKEQLAKDEQYVRALLKTL